MIKKILIAALLFTGCSLVEKEDDRVVSLTDDWIRRTVKSTFFYKIIVDSLNYKCYNTCIEIRKLIKSRRW